jgi:2,4-didehydro-3-deoxy-L-rhamnonate hydrolase
VGPWHLTPQGGRSEEPDSWQLAWLLRPCNERTGGRRAANRFDEIAPPHWPRNPAGAAQTLMRRKIIATIFAGERQKRNASGCSRKRSNQGETPMKLCRYDDDRLGVVRGDLVHDVTEAQVKIRAAAPYAMKGDAVIAALPAWRSRLEEMATITPGKPVSAVKLLSPVARPSKLVAAPTNYKAHIEEMAARAATQNIKPSPAIGTAGLFLKANSSLVGPSEGVAIRFPERRNEHEVELAIIFGKEGSDIPRAKALDHVAGYCIGLDMTARGPEDRSFRKSIDTYSVLGPWMVTADEIADPDNVPLTIAVNGEVKQTSNTKQLIYDCRKLIEWGSTFYTFFPGDVLYTGTPEGVSPVKPGDVMRARIDPIGEMSVPVRAHQHV